MIINYQPTKLWGANGSLLLARDFFILNGAKMLKQDSPQDIHHTLIDDTGTIRCAGTGGINGEAVNFTRLPVWSENIDNVCREGAQLLPVSINKPYSTEALDSLF